MTEEEFEKWFLSFSVEERIFISEMSGEYLDGDYISFVVDYAESLITELNRPTTNSKKISIIVEFIAFLTALTRDNIASKYYNKYRNSKSHN